VFDRVLVVDSY